MPWDDVKPMSFPTWNDNVKPINPTPSAFPEWDDKDRDTVLMEWEARKSLLAVATQREIEFRKYVVSRAFPDKHEGVNTVPLNNGYALKASIKYNYTLADNDTVKKTLERIAKIGNGGAAIAEKLVSWKASFLLTDYRILLEDAQHSDPMLSEPAKAILKEINTMLTITEAAPALEIKGPKKK